MAREKAGCREIFAVLAEKYPLTVPKSEAQRILGISRETLRRRISDGKIKADGRNVSLWEIARYLC